MNLRFLLPAFATVIAVSSCSHRIVRTGYAMEKGQHQHCDLLITRHDSLAEGAKKVGSIRLEDSGFSVRCSEGDALLVLQGEGCALGADLAVIHSEQLPDLFSTCYRCHASFYAFPDSARANLPDEEMPLPTESLQGRSPRKGSVALQVLGFALGFAIGYGIMTLVLGG